MAPSATVITIAVFVVVAYGAIPEAKERERRMVHKNIWYPNYKVDMLDLQCSGVLFDSEHAIMPAHCFPYENIYYRVRCGLQQRVISTIMKHENYTAYTVDNIAIVKFDSPLMLDPNLGCEVATFPDSVDIDAGDMNDDMYNPLNVYVVSNVDGTQDLSMYAMYTVLTDAQCTRYMEGYFTVNNATNLCMLDFFGSTTLCHADSGALAIHQDGTVLGMAVGADYWCSFGYNTPGVFMNLAPYMTWIDDTLTENC